MPRPCPPGLLPVHAAGDYADALRELVLAHKERSALGLARPLGRLVADVVSSLITPGTPDTSDSLGGATLVPVPSHPTVVRSRGHDPVLRITRHAASVLRARGRSVAVCRALSVQGRPQDQAELSAQQRRVNLDGRFRARTAGSRPPRSTLLLVDDVVTTGSTLREAQRALAAAGWWADGAVVIAATRRRNDA